VTPAEKRLKKSLDDLICHYDQIANRAAALEGVLVEDFYEDDRFDDLLEALARFKPSGGEYLYSETDLLKLAKNAARKLDSAG